MRLTLLNWLIVRGGEAAEEAARKWRNRYLLNDLHSDVASSLWFKPGCTKSIGKWCVYIWHDDANG